MNKPKLITVDLGPYASLLYKYDLFNEEEYRLDSSKGLKFLHFNIDKNHMSKRMFHIWQSRTLAVLSISPNGIRKIANDFLNLESNSQLFTTMVVGVTFLSKDDNYSREIGRNESVKQMKELDMEVVNVNITKTHIYIKLAPYAGVALTLRLNKNTGFATVGGYLTGKSEDRN